MMRKVHTFSSVNYFSAVNSRTNFVYERSGSRGRTQRKYFGSFAAVEL